VTTERADVSDALATLRSRWGAAAPTRWTEVVGALATVPVPAVPAPQADPDRARVLSTGFAALDAILGPGGVPRGMGVELRGDLSSGRTTLALRLVAEAQAAGAIVAWLDLAAAFDPVEAVARGIRPEWLVVVNPADAEEGIAIAGALLSSRTVDLLVVDLPSRLPGTAGPAKVADRLGRLGALARRAAITLVVLEPPNLAGAVATAVGEATGIRLELARTSWIRLGRDVVGQRTEVTVGRNRAGPPGRRATLRILYAEGGERDACLRRDGLLADAVPGAPEARPPLSVGPASVNAPAIPVPGNRTHATPPSPSTAPPPRPGAAAPALRLVAGGSDRARRPAVGAGDRPRRERRGAGPRRPGGAAARVGASAGAGGDVPRRRAGG
jgi:hypothetical protein